MKIVLNGTEKDLDDNIYIIDLIKKFKISNDKSGVAVALNNDVISKSEWKRVKVKENDRIEIIQAVQGG